jgi:hypothetical protein
MILQPAGISKLNESLPVALMLHDQQQMVCRGHAGFIVSSSDGTRLACSRTQAMQQQQQQQQHGQ